MLEENRSSSGSPSGSALLCLSEACRHASHDQLRQLHTSAAIMNNAHTPLRPCRESLPALMLKPLCISLCVYLHYGFFFKQEERCVPEWRKKKGLRESCAVWSELVVVENSQTGARPCDEATVVVLNRKMVFKGKKSVFGCRCLDVFGFCIYISIKLADFHLPKLARQE